MVWGVSSQLNTELPEAMTCASSEPGSGPRARRACGYLPRLERPPFLTCHERETEAHGERPPAKSAQQRAVGLGPLPDVRLGIAAPGAPEEDGGRGQRTGARGPGDRDSGPGWGWCGRGRCPPTHTSPRPWLLQRISFSVVEAETGILKFKSSSFYMPVSHMQPLELPVSLPRDLVSWCSPGLILGPRRRQGSPSEAVPAEDPAGPRPPRARPWVHREGGQGRTLPSGAGPCRVGRWQTSHFPAAKGQPKLLFLCLSEGNKVPVRVAHRMVRNGGGGMASGGSTR